MEISRESPDAYIRQVDGHLIVEPGRVTATEIGAIYRDLAVFCIEKQIRRVLVKPCDDDDPAGERCLRNALTTMLLAGLPAEFRIALVAGTRRIAARYRDTERDLCTAGVDAKIFDSEDAAARWLNGSGDRAAGAVA
jgi:hypothetical protein